MENTSISILPISILDFCKQRLWPLLCSQQSIWHFLRSEEEVEEQEHQTVKTKKAPLQEGPNYSSSQEQIAFFLTQKDLCLLVNFEFLTMCGFVLEC